MTMTRDDSALMARLLAEGNEADAELVKDAGNDALHALRAAGVICAQDDRRAMLDAAIYRYVLRCRGPVAAAA